MTEEFLRVRDLIAHLSTLDQAAQDRFVVVDGYEGGASRITLRNISVETARICDEKTGISVLHINRESDYNTSGLFGNLEVDE